MTQRTVTYGMAGGLDLITPPIERSGGRAIGGFNYEPRPEGYRRISGYERDDGTGLPSEEKYYVINFTSGSQVVSAGEGVSGSNSGASAEVLIDAVVTSGSYAGSDAAGYLVVCNVSGTFDDGEFLQVGGFNHATADGSQVYEGATNDNDHQTFDAAAIEAKRAKVLAVPGSGPVRGVWHFGGKLYSFRDNTLQTECRMYESDGAGWQQVSLGHQIEYTAGTTEFAQGNTITGAISAATATVERVLPGETSGEGRLILSSVSGVFQAAESLNVGGSSNATAKAASAAITLQPGGRYEFENHNYYGGSSTRRMYGCDGVNNAFEFDGSVFVPIVTGHSEDAPIFIAAHNSQLVLAYRGGTFQVSSLGEPVRFIFFEGAGEFGMGDDITGLVAGYSGPLIIFTRNRIGALYGRVLSGPDSDADLQIIGKEVGAIERTVQNVSQPVFYDNAGIRDLASTQNYGNFRQAIKSDDITPYIKAKQQSGASVTASYIVRGESQYWLFFDDYTGIVVSFADRRPALMPVRLDHIVRCAYSVETDDGVEVIYFGSDDGYVYRAHSGNSFDGGQLKFLLRLAFNNLRSPRTNKRFIKAVLELATNTRAKIGVAADFSYGSPELPSVTRTDFSVFGGGGFWDEVYWDNFFWSQVEGQAEADIDGLGTNVSLAIGGESLTDRPHTIHGITYHYSLRGLKR